MRLKKRERKKTKGESVEEEGQNPERKFYTKKRKKKTEGRALRNERQDFQTWTKFDKMEM